MARNEPVQTDTWDDETWSDWNSQMQVAHDRRKRLQSIALIAALVFLIVALVFVGPVFASEGEGCGGG